MLTVIFILISASWYTGYIKWDKKVRINEDTTGAQFHPIAYIDKNTFDVYCVWESDPEGDGNYRIDFAYSRDTGKTFINIKNISSNNYNNRYPWITVDKEGRIYI
jgi:hypothetical protein